jgi:hypothetical protein
MAKIIAYMQELYLDFCAAQKELNAMGFVVVPTGYTFVIAYMDTAAPVAKNTDQTCSVNTDQ